MAHAERAATQHPMCTCPPITFGGPAPDRSACTGGSFAHPVIDAATMLRLADSWKQRLVQS